MRNTVRGLFAVPVQECLTGIAKRKKGITERDYRKPLTVEDQRPGR
jgi:hypothetical protein